MPNVAAVRAWPATVLASDTSWRAEDWRPLRQVDRATGLPRVLSTVTARRLGLSRSAVRHAIDRYGWQQLARGVVLTQRAEPTRADWACVGLELAGPGAAVSGWDVANLHGLGTKSPPDDEVLVLDTEGTNRLIAGRVRVRPTARAFRSGIVMSREARLSSLPVVDPARAVADTALRYHTFDPVRAMTTAAIQRELCTPEQLLYELETSPRNGSGWLRAALRDVLDGARSIAEAAAVDLLRQVQVPLFELNVPLVTRSGVLVAIADVLWRDLRAVAEIDSREYHFFEREWTRTGRRHNRLTTSSLALEHFAPSEIRDRGLDWARDVERWLRARAAEIGVPYVPDPRPLRPGPHGPRPYVLPEAPAGAADCA